jgi:glycogen synthase
MKILLVSQFYPPDTGGGGIAVYARNLAVGLTARGHDVRVVSKAAAGSVPFRVVEGIPVHRVRSPFASYRWSRIPVLGRHVRFMRNIVYAWRVRTRIRELSADWTPDVVEYADIDAEALFHPAPTLYVVRCHGNHKALRPFYGKKEYDYWRRGVEVLESMAMRGAVRLSVPTQWFRDEIMRVERIPERTVEVVVNSLDTTFFTPSAAESLRDPFSVLYVGRLEPLKGAVLFGEAIPLIAAAVPQAHFTFLGADRRSASGKSQKEEILSRLSGGGVMQRVRFHGHDSPEVFREYYRRSAVFVMPSRFETFGYTVAEAMACGKPVVVSDIPVLHEMIEEGSTGVFFKTGDAGALAAKVIELLQSPRKRAELGQEARGAVEKRYAIAVGALQAEQFYGRVIEAQGHDRNPQEVQA